MDDRRDPMDVLIAGLKPRTDALGSLHATAGAEDLLTKILATNSTETKPLRSKRHVVRTLALAATLAAAVAVVWVGESTVRPRQATAVTFEEQDGYVSARITDPSASKAEFDAAFAKRGFDITVKLVPASPSLVGTVPRFYGDQQANRHEIKMYYDTSCYTDGGGWHCPVGIIVPSDFAGHAVIDIGRAAQPGERYEMAGNAFLLGEPLHCSNLPGMTVDQAIPVLQDLGIRPIWRSVDRSIDVVSGIDPSTIGSLLVQTESSGRSLGVIEIWVGPNVPGTLSGPAEDDWNRALSVGC